MARKKVREYTAKQLILKHLSNYSSVDGLDKGLKKLNSVLVTDDTNFRRLKHEVPELCDAKLIAKPDMCFGKRGKNNLVCLNKDIEEIQAFILERMENELTMGKVKGKLTHFLIESFIPHKEEYYVSFTTERERNVINFSPAGGIEVEENWDQVVSVGLEVDQDIETIDFNHLLKDMEDSKRGIAKDFIKAMYNIFCDLDFTLLEMNPWCFDYDGDIVPLDMRAELDDTAYFKNRKKWGENIEFPQPFGKTETEEESFVSELDSKTGASLKLTILNPNGRIWTMVAGGGASVVFADAFSESGYGHLIGNYGEYSGNPNEEETYNYAKTIISLATKDANPDEKRALIIGGGIANFTDVAKTFKGITHAIKEKHHELKSANVKIFVRRGGPNYKAGLDMMRNLGRDLNLNIEVYGPEMEITGVVPLAIEWITSK